MTLHMDAAVLGGLFGVVTGAFVPALIGRIPEPESDPDASKELYADIANLPGLRGWSIAVCGVIGAMLGALIGWSWPLSFVLVLVPVGMALAVIDFRTWLLPTVVIWPTYAVVAVLVLLSAAVPGDWENLLWAVIGQGCAFALFWVMYRLPGRGMGYGDVRLSHVLGLVLGWFGAATWILGLWIGFILGAVAWVPLRLLRITQDKHFPFGPFMLIGALTGVVLVPGLGLGLGIDLVP